MRQYMEQIFSEPLVLIQDHDIEKITRMLPVKCCMQFATVEVFKRKDIHLGKTEMLRYHIRYRHHRR